MASETIKRVRLGEVATYVNGYAFKPTDWSDSGKPIIRIQDLTGNSYQMNRFSGSVPAKYDVIKGDVLISWSASLGVYVWEREDALLNQHIFKVVFDKSEVDKRYFFHQVGLILRKAASEAHGCTMKHLTKPVFDALPFVLPPLPAQRRIAAALDKISEMKRNAEARLQKLDLLVKARFNEMFGDVAYEEKELSAVTTFIDYRGKTPTKSESGVPLITAKNVRSFGFSIEPREYIPEEMYLGWMTRGFPAVGDVLFTTEAPLGNVCRIPNVYDKFAVGQRIVTMQPHRDILDATYLEFALRSGTFQRKVFEKSSGSTVTGIRSKLLEKLALPLPPLSLQRSFAAFVEKVEALKATAQASLARVDLLYRAKLQEYFG